MISRYCLGALLIGVIWGCTTTTGKGRTEGPREKEISGNQLGGKLEPGAQRIVYFDRGVTDKTLFRRWHTDPDPNFDAQKDLSNIQILVNKLDLTTSPEPLFHSIDLVASTPEKANLRLKFTKIEIYTDSQPCYVTVSLGLFDRDDNLAGSSQKSAESADAAGCFLYDGAGRYISSIKDSMLEKAFFGALKDL